MNAEEPLLAPAANETVSTTGDPLPEQAGVAKQVIPRGISMLNLIHQWQPMGIRIIVNLPFIGNDQDVLFYIRNGPFIPRWDKNYKATNPFKAWPKPDLPDDTTLRQYAWNNTKNVWLGKSFDKFNYGQSGVIMTQYDYPPILSTLSQAFRRWRGDMQYRLRSVAGFATQGYLIVAPYKNIFSPIGSYDEYATYPAITRQDTSYREAMMNAYVMADTSMFRHVEVTVPYEYPAPWYDQYAWLARRVSPNSAAVNATVTESDYKTKMGFIVTAEPHGDNFIAVMLRGKVETTETGGQIAFELEYRAMEGFQFADPGLPPNDLTEPYENISSQTRIIYDRVKTVPDPKLTSDGFGRIVESSSYSKVKRAVFGDKEHHHQPHHRHHHHVEKRADVPAEVILHPVTPVPDSRTTREREFSY
uniref:Structural protein n=1 Tax=Electric ant polycipivirus 2 TaxID=3003606 RepID=A0AA95E5P5_9VIRU|nr:structural protein [Electric ant polycipivirus 2]